MPMLSLICTHCNSQNLLETLEPLDSVHYGRVTCGDCQRFIRWMSKPKIPPTSIVKLLHGIGLEPWERSFLKAVACRNPTSAENIVIQAIEAKVNPVPSGRGSE